MDQPVDLSILLTKPPQSSSPETIASITLCCDVLGLVYTEGLLYDPLIQRERDDLHWYLEEYWKWPYLEFAVRGKQVEALLIEIGKRLYQGIFGNVEAQNIVTQWKKLPATQRQISIISEIPRAFSLPWELLHDEQGFLILDTHHSISIVRRLPQYESSPLLTPFEPPLRILLVTARPEDEGFLDPRSVAREMLDKVQAQVEAGAVDIEFLRPPTFSNLRTRLSDRKLPVHVLHFDGHGIFDEGEKQGLLLFETEAGRGSRVKANHLAKVLRDSGIQLAILTACQSAVGASDDVFSSVAAQLIRSGVDAVIAMSASLLVASATRYAEAFYRALTVGIPAQQAQEQARQHLHNDPRRHMFRLHRDEEGHPVELFDWWLPHFYQQRPVTLQPKQIIGGEVQSRALPLQRLNEEMPPEPRYGFSGRGRELLQMERHLLRGKLVVVHGFGGVGKTALVREAADWLTRTKMYDGACFVSFEHGGDAAVLLSTLGHFLDIYDSLYIPNDTQAALARLKPVLKKKRTLVIADNLETILPGSEAPLDVVRLTQLWDVLLQLANIGAGVLLTSRDTAFEDARLRRGSRVVHIELKGLHSDDAYTLAIRLLTDLEIDHSLVPYEGLCELLKQLDYHPLAIQLVLPALRKLPFTRICVDFAELLPGFADNTITGNNRSLLASLDYSLKRLSEEQRALLFRLAQFEGGASEEVLLNVTQIPRSEWIELRSVLKQAALLIIEPIHEGLPDVPFLHFHPILIPFLRTFPDVMNDVALRERFAHAYFAWILFLHTHHRTSAVLVRAIIQRDLPNLRRALKLMQESGNSEFAFEMANLLAMFLDILGQWREGDEQRRLVSKVATNVDLDDRLSHIEYEYEMNMGEEAFRKGNISAASSHFSKLLARIEKQPEGSFIIRRPTGQPQGSLVGRGEYEQCRTLLWLARCSIVERQLDVAQVLLLKALTIVDAHIKLKPDDENFVNERGGILADLGTVLKDMGQFSEALAAYKESMEIAEQQHNVELIAIVLQNTGDLELLEGNYTSAQVFYNGAMNRFRALGQLSAEAATLQRLGMLAERQKEWVEAERYYREGLAISMQLGEEMSIAAICNQLASVAKNNGRPTEAESWLKRSLEFAERVCPSSPQHALCLNSLASVLLDQVQTGYASQSRLVEAKNFAERALAIQQTFDASSNSWTTLGILADIAKLEGQTEIAQGYYRREREAFSAFPDNHYEIHRQHSSLIADITAAVKGNTQVRAKVEIALSSLETEGWHITTPIHRIWMGERNWDHLVEDLDRQSALLILCVLQTLEQSGDTKPTKVWDRTPEQIIASLPPTIREALVQGNIAVFEEAFAALSTQEQQTVAEVIHYLQVSDEETEESVANNVDNIVQKFEPLLQAIAAVAIGNATWKNQIEEELIDLEIEGWHLKDAVQHIWSGERNVAALTSALDEQDATLVQRILEIIAGA